MQSSERRSARPLVSFAGRLPLGVAVLLISLAAAGCTLDGKPTASMASRATIAFDSIDGPPAGIFHKLVQNLNDEAQTRGVAVVSRDDASQYRVRGYLAAHVVGDRTSIAWVWDIYDADQRRTLRLGGEESGKRSKDAWSSADDQVLQRIARSGMDQLVAFLNTTPAPMQDEPMPTLVSSFGDNSPESAGIFPLSAATDKAGAEPETSAAQPAPGRIPVSPRRHAAAGLQPESALAYAQ
jgi:hypothetical protein